MFQFEEVSVYWIDKLSMDFDSYVSDTCFNACMSWRKQLILCR